MSEHNSEHTSPEDVEIAVKPRLQSVARATGVVAAVTLTSRVLGMLRDVLIANYFGAGFATDAFFTAFKIPNLLRRLVAEGSLSTAFIPVISEELEKGERAARKALRATSGFCLLLTVTLCVLGMIFAPQLTLLFAVGWSDQPEKLQLASDLLRIMFPYIILVSLTALSAGALNALGYFGWAASSPALLNVVFILFIVCFSGYFSEAIFSLPVALLFGGLLGVLPMLISLRQLGYSLRPASPFRSPAVRRLVTLMLPAVLSSSVYQVMVFLNSMLVTMLEEGAPSWLYFSDRLFQFPLGVFSIAIATAVLPSLSRLATKNDQEGFSGLLSETLAWVAFVTIPATVGLIVLALPIVQVIYQSGEFGPQDSKNTALSLIGFAIGLWPLSTHTVLVRAFLAKKDSLTPAKVAVLSIAANIILAFMLMGPPVHVDANPITVGVMALQPYLPAISLGHVGLALAGSIASIISLGLLGAALSKIGTRLHWSPLLFSLCRTLFGATLMGVTLSVLTPRLGELHPVLSLLVLIGAGIATFVCTAALLGSKELKMSMEVLRKLKHRSSR